MSYDKQVVRMSESGRISIPAKQRRQLGLEEGGMVVTHVQDGELRIRPVRTVLAELQAKVSGLLASAGMKPEALLSEELVADRRAEAARDEQEYLESRKFHRAGDR